MTGWEAALLGVVQGVFMFVPVSSTSHLVLTQHLLIALGSDLPAPESASMILFDLVVHVGTMVSVAIVFRRSLVRLVGGAWNDLRGVGRRDRLSLRLIGLGAISVLATGAVGFPARELFGSVFAHPTVVALALAGTGALLFASDRLRRGRHGLADLTIAIAIGIGVAQGLALLPGFSRSGLTIVVALLMGVRRRWAGEYSFFLAVPTILGATLLQATDVLRSVDGVVLGLAPMAIGFAVAAVVGAFALWAVMRILLAARFRWFAYYVWAVAAVVLITGTFPDVRPF
ncbi:MAG: undecaprenyl-diphosphate phosphatase [Trueperaceae bacterium]